MSLVKMSILGIPLEQVPALPGPLEPFAPLQDETYRGLGEARGKVFAEEANALPLEDKRAILR
jgi:hypothetical protein